MTKSQQMRVLLISLRYWLTRTEACYRRTRSTLRSSSRLRSRNNMKSLINCRGCDEILSGRGWLRCRKTSTNSLPFKCVHSSMASRKSKGRGRSWPRRVSRTYSASDCNKVSPMAPFRTRTSCVPSLESPLIHRNTFHRVSLTSLTKRKPSASKSTVAVVKMMCTP